MLALSGVVVAAFTAGAGKWGRLVAKPVGDSRRSRWRRERPVPFAAVLFALLILAAAVLVGLDAPVQALAGAVIVAAGALVYRASPPPGAVGRDARDGIDAGLWGSMKG